MRPRKLAAGAAAVSLALTLAAVVRWSRDTAPPVETARARPSPARLVSASSIEEVERRASGTVAVTEDRSSGGVSTIRVSAGGDLFPEALEPVAKVEAFLAAHGA